MSLFRHSNMEFLFFTSAVTISLLSRRFSVMSSPPMAKRIAKEVYFGRSPEIVDLVSETDAKDLIWPRRKNIDYYYWLRDDKRKNPEILEYLKNENSYTESSLSHLENKRTELYERMLKNLKESDIRVPYRRGDYFYYTKTIEGKPYAYHCRKYCNDMTRSPTALDDIHEEIVLDENNVAASYDYCDIAGVEPSPSHDYYGYCVDSTGYETYDINLMKFNTTRSTTTTTNNNNSSDNDGNDHILIDSIQETSGGFEWGADDSTIFYFKHDKEHRPYQLWLHTINDTTHGNSDNNDSNNNDLLVLQESDGLFWLGMDKSNSGRFLIISSGSQETSEEWLLDLEGVKGAEAHRQLVTEFQSCYNNNSDDIGKSLEMNQGRKPTSRFFCLQRREKGVIYSCEHHSDYLYKITNENNCKNRKLMKSGLSSGLDSSGYTPRFTDVKAYDNEVQINAFYPFKHAAVIFGRKDGTQQVWLTHTTSSTPSNSPSRSSTSSTSNNKKETFSSDWKMLRFGSNNNQDEDHTYSCWAESNYNFDADTFRVGFSALTCPRTTLEVSLTDTSSSSSSSSSSMKYGDMKCIKTTEVPHYDASQYTSRRLMVTARDGRRVPVSLVYNKNYTPFINEINDNTDDNNDNNDNNNSKCIPRPMILYGYGSYGSCMDPSFDYKKLAILDQGVVYCIAHIRGGGEMGRHWYEDEGKYLSKLNTFNDFADVAKYLINNNMTSEQQLCGVGRSAGGLLIGATANMNPHLFKCLILDVPFVDVMTTMSDPSIPLTVGEWEEWGSPHLDKYHEYMRQYSPVDNINSCINYPSMLVTGGLYDPRVAYWEPAKFVAKIRHAQSQREDNSDSSNSNGNDIHNPLYLKTDLTSGHFSASDRYKFMKEMAFEYAFILDQILPKA